MTRKHLSFTKTKRKPLPMDSFVSTRANGLGNADRKRRRHEALLRSPAKLFFDQFAVFVERHMGDGPEGNTEAIPIVTAFPLSRQGSFGKQIAQVPYGGRRRGIAPGYER
jgi:hypothetical protein